MMDTGSWASADTIRVLGWTLAHFLWQGAALAAILLILLSVIRSATVRYATALAVFLLMTAAPVCTFFWLRDRIEPVPAVSATHPAVATLGGALTPGRNSADTTMDAFRSVDWPACFVWAWLAGVAGLGMRAAGGWIFIQRLYREKRTVLGPELARRCTHLQQALGIRRAVSYCESALVDAPAVLGWFRPVVLLPASALTGLSPEQLDAIIAHELAHIKRLDCFVNVYQIAAETLLFYHPAVWWVSKLIRQERENCCDDVAVAVCGDARVYARALTMLETWRAAPALVIAANSGSLKSRISRLLGSNTMIRSLMPAGVAAVGVLCAAGVVVASTGFHYTWAAGTTAGENASLALDWRPSVPPAPLMPQISFREESARPAKAVFLAAANGFKRAPAAVAIAEPQAPDAKQSSTQAGSAPNSSYTEDLRAAGLKDLTVDDLIALKIQGVTSEYVREVRQSWPDATVHDIIGMKVQGVTPDYVREVRQTWPNAGIHDIIGMKVQGITPEYVHQVKQTWPDATLHDIIGMKVQGVTPDYVREVRQTWPNAGVHEIIGMKVQGITPDYVRQIRQTWPDASLHDVIGMKVQGIDADYVHSLEAAGLGKLTLHQVIEAKVMGISPEFIREVQAHGFKNLTLRQLIGLKMANVF